MTRQVRTSAGILLVLGMLAVAGGYLYAPSMNAPFIFDDIDNIVENPFIRMTTISPEKLGDVLKSPLPTRFLANITFAFNYYFDRYNVTGFHIVNLIVHILTALLVFLLARQTLTQCGVKGYLAAFLAAALWLVNPVHTQSVTYIVQRMNALSAMFVLLALACYIQARRAQVNGRSGVRPVILLAGTALAGLCGLASKETAAILPVILFLYEWFFFQNLDRAWLRKQLGWIIVAVIFLALVALIYMDGNPVAKLLSMYEKRGFTPGQRLLTQPQVVLYYLTLLFFPHPTRLILDYNFPLALSPLHPATTLPALLALPALAAAAVYAARKHRLLSFAVLWFLVTLVIESSIIGQALIFEHRTYLPSVFPAIAVGYLLTRRIKPLPATILVTGALIAFCAYSTYQRNRLWADPLLFWQDNVRKSPDTAVPNNNLGLIYKNMGVLDKALFFSTKALALRKTQFGEGHPKTAESLNNIGLIYYRQGKYEKALVCHLEALDILKAVFGNRAYQLFETYNNIGLSYDAKGDFDMAEAFYRQALDIERTISTAENLRTASVYNNLGSVWYNRGDYVKALDNFQNALAIRTKALGMKHQQIAESYNNIGLAYASMGDYETAFRYYRQALDIELTVLGVNHPYTAATYFNLGLTSYARKDYIQTIDYMRRVLILYNHVLEPNHPYLETAQTILHQALLNNQGNPSAGYDFEGVEDSRIQGVR